MLQFVNECRVWRNSEFLHAFLTWRALISSRACRRSVHSKVYRLVMNTACGDHGSMNSAWWTLAGFALGVIIMLPLTRLLLRRAERRARQAERRARDAERLAELGSMTGGLAHEIKN